MINAFIFDIGNVLLPFDFTVALRRLREKSDVDSLMNAMEPVKFAYESGAIERVEFLARMRGVLHYTGTEEEFIAVWEDIFTENTPMLDLVRALHGRHPLYLLSNTSDLHMDYLTGTYPVTSACSRTASIPIARSASMDRPRHLRNRAGALGRRSE